MRPLAALLVLSLLAAPATAQLIPDGATPEKVADGYRFTEGPAAGPDGCIYFTDIPAELILKYDPQTGETETVVEESGQANGLMFDKLGQLYSCHHGFRDVHHVVLFEDGWLFANACPDQFEGKKLNSPNDLSIDSDGNLYFTDPRYGNRDSMEMEVEGVYFRDVDCDEIEIGDDVVPAVWKPLTRIIDDLTRPNGIVLSTDESILYVADNGTNEIFAYDIEAPGEIENKRLFARLNDGEGGGPDGMCVDAQGRLYAAGQGKVWIYNPDGSAAGVIDVGPQCTNCTFANDGKTLYITANHGLYRIELNTDEGLPAEENEFGIRLPHPDAEARPGIPDDAIELRIRLVRPNGGDAASVLGAVDDGVIELLVENAVVEEERLLEAIAAHLSAEGDSHLVIRADAELYYQDFLAIVDRIRESDLDVSLYLTADHSGD